jgi:hypothetical protein
MTVVAEIIALHLNLTTNQDLSRLAGSFADMLKHMVVAADKWAKPVTLSFFRPSAASSCPEETGNAPELVNHCLYVRTGAVEKGRPMIDVRDRPAASILPHAWAEFPTGAL